MYRIYRCDSEPLIRSFLALPGRLYDEEHITGSRAEERELIEGRHFLNKYLTFTPYVLLDENSDPAGRVAVTEYPGDAVCFFGFFECTEDAEAAETLIGAVESFAASRGYKRVEGPLDCSLWIRYRFKTNCFDRLPYIGEPYNKPYYAELFRERGYKTVSEYASNLYGRLPAGEADRSKARQRYDMFTSKGYVIRAPRRSEWDRCIRDVYGLIARLYTGFVTYKPITEDEFVGYFDSYRRMADLSVIRLAYLDGVPVGFLMAVPDYGNLAARRRSPAVLLRALRIRRRARRYVLMYMGVLPEHRGLGLALAYPVMLEIEARGATAVGSLIRIGNLNLHYGENFIEERCMYEFLGKDL